MQDKLLDVGGKIELFDQLLVGVVEIVSCIKETVGEAADETVAVIKVAGKSVATGACRNVAVKILVLFEKRFYHSAGEDRSLGISDGGGLIVTRNVCPKSGCMTEEVGVFTKGKKIVEVIDATAVPPMSARIVLGGAGCLGIVEVQSDGQVGFAAETEQIYRVGIIVKHTEFDLAAYLYAVKIDCGTQCVDGIGTVRIGRVAQNEAIGCTHLVFQATAKGDRHGLTSQKRGPGQSVG